MSELPKYLLFLLFGYLSGSVLYACLLPSLLRHKDVTELSKDGNPGAANVFMHVGIAEGILVLLLELLKGAVPVFLASRALDPAEPLFALVLAAPVLGHAFPIWRKGRGGKAIASAFGCLLGLFPAWRPLIALAFFYLLFSLVIVIRPHLYRSVAAFSCFSAACFCWPEARTYALGCCIISAIVVLKHLMGHRGEHFSVRLAFRRQPREG